MHDDPDCVTFGQSEHASRHARERWPSDTRAGRMVSIARTRRAPLMPSEVWAFVTAFSAYSICTSLPEGLNVVSEYEYADSPMPLAAAARQRWAPPRPQLDIAGNTLRPTARQRARVALLPGAPSVRWIRSVTP